MNDWITTLTGILMGAVMGILMLCGLILLRGGFCSHETPHPEPTRLQRVFGLTLLYISVGFIPFIINEALLTEPLPWLSRLSNALAIETFGMIPLHSIILRQKPIRLHHILKVYLPTLPMLVLSLMGESYSTLFDVAYIFSYFYLVVFVLYSLSMLQRWDRLMQDHYSDIVNKQTQWYRHLMFPFLGLMLLWIPWEIWPEFRWIALVYYGAEIYIFIRFTAFALKQEEFVIDTQIEEEVNAEISMLKTAASSVSRPNAESQSMQTREISDGKPVWAEKMERALTEQHLYRREDLTRDDLAEITGVNRTYITRYLHESLNTTFYEYINGFRLDESETLLAEGSKSITEIAIHCGFRDRNAFYRNFSKRHGMSPSEWQNSLRLDGRLQPS